MPGVNSRLSPPVLLALALATLPSPARAGWPPADLNVPLVVASGAQSNQFPARDGQGGFFVAWDDRRGSGADIYLQRVLASGKMHPAWPLNGRLVCSATGDQTAPQVVTDGADGAIVVWTDARSGITDLYAQHVFADGLVDPAWPDQGRQLVTTAFVRSLPRVLSDGVGGAFVAWRESNPGTSFDIYAHHLLSNGTMDPVIWPAGGRVVCSAAGNQSLISMVSGTIGPFLVWSDARGGPATDLYFHQLLPNGNLNPSIPVDGLALCTAAGSQIALRAVGDGLGGFVLPWQDFRSGATSDIYAHHVTAIAQLDPGWPANGLALCTATGNQSFAVAAYDSGGGVIVGWQDDRDLATSGVDVYATRVWNAGVLDPAWPANGLAISALPDSQTSPRVVPDGVDGTLFVWQDRRNGASWDLYARRITVAVTTDPQWNPAGEFVSSAPQNQTSPIAFPDGAQGALTVFADTRNGDPDLYLQRISLEGNTGHLAPLIMAVEDIPDDQGGKLRIRWEGAYRDQAPDLEFESYRVWRRSSGVFWEFIGEVPAIGIDGYSIVAPTVADFASGDPHFNTFYVSALDSVSGVFLDSPPDSGYSVDNLAPGPPSVFAATWEGGAARLSWAASPESDVTAYRLHRGSDARFVPGRDNLIAEITATGFVDREAGAGHYKLTAVDRSGNQSAFASLEAGPPPGTAAPAELSLSAPAPNPLRDATMLHLSMPAPGPVAVTVLDVQGRGIRELTPGVLPAGVHSLRWNGDDRRGRPVPGGLYFIRTDVAGRVITRRVVVAR